MLADTQLLRFLGFNSQGDLGPWTFYTGARNQLVYFVKAPPLEPPSELQQTRRNAFRLNAYVWRAIGPEKRADWESAAKKARLVIHGFNLFTYWNLTQDNRAIQTVERLSGIKLIPLQYPLP